MDYVVLENERLRIAVDRQTGAIREAVHKGSDISLIADPGIAVEHPFMLVFQDGTTLQTWQRCEVSAGGAPATVTICWTLDRGLELTAILRLDAGTGELHLAPKLENPENLPLAALSYPYIAGIGGLGRIPEEDELVHPYATGFLVRDPLHRLPVAESETAGQQPVVLGLYPEGFSGSTMQFMAYSAAGKGGFYVATEDSTGQEKWLNFYRHSGGDLRLAVWHGPNDYADRRTIAPGYTTVLAALDGGTWYDDAERYQTWALSQPWVERGPLWSRTDRCRWLLEDVGLCTFGINPRDDRSAWLEQIDQVAGTPVLHILGPSWPKVGSDYMKNHPGGIRDWFPATFHQENLRVIRGNGDRLVPFEFDLLFGRGDGLTEGAAGTQALQRIPQPPLSGDAYDFPFLCPAAPFTQELHVARDRTLVEDYGIDGVYHDISVNNVRHICLSTAHQHNPGDTRALTRSYRHLLGATGAAMRAAAHGDTVPQGTEMINEQMLPYVDFYQARAEAAPAAPFEAAPFRDLIKAGTAEKIPLFTYVYHEYGPTRLDGWAKLSREQGDLVYFILGRVFLQGGLIELNYEFSPLEECGDLSDAASEHYYRFDERHYSVDPSLTAFVKILARARTGVANRYLAYGAMRRPAAMAVDGEATVGLDYFLFNCGTALAEYEERGTMQVPAVLQTAWRYRDESAAWLLLNIAPDERTVDLTLDAGGVDGRYGQAHELTAYRGDIAEPLGVLEGLCRRTVRLPSRSPVLLEALPITTDRK